MDHPPKTLRLKETLPKRRREAASSQTRHCAIRMRQEGEHWKEIERVTGYGRWAMRRWKKDYELTGSASPTKKLRAPRTALSTLATLELNELIRKYPCAYLDELQWWIYQMCDETASISAIQRHCARHGWDRKRVTTVPAARNPVTMDLHARAWGQFHWSQFCFVDEAHKRGRDLGRQWGRAQGGKPCFVQLSPHLATSTMLASLTSSWSSCSRTRGRGRSTP